MTKLYMKVKICGIRSLEGAQVSIDAGADFLGFNFVPSSQRYIEPIKAKEILKQLSISNYQLSIKSVGVFQNELVEKVNMIADDLSLDFVQLHGEEDERYMEEITAKIIKKIVISTGVERSSATEFIDQVNPAFQDTCDSFLDYARNDNIRYFLLDRKFQGTGEMVDLEKAKKIAEKFQIFFAGGLTLKNVSHIVSKIKPFAVDVASGVETNGVMDSAKLKKFICTAKGATL